jgi:hypothetical protein
MRLPKRFVSFEEDSVKAKKVLDTHTVTAVYWQSALERKAASLGLDDQALCSAKSCSLMRLEA